MSTSFEKHQKRRLISSYFSVVTSIALVLFLVGMLGLLVLNAKSISDNFKEQVVLTIYLEDNSKGVEIKQLEKSLAFSEYVKQTEFVSKESAANFMKLEYGEDFLDDIGYNPLKNSIQVNLKADYVTATRLDSISESTLKKNFVEDIKYDKDLVSLMNSNVKKISFWILIVSVIFTSIAVLLINSSIRLAVYSKRFSIKTMQMVGATRWFIAWPMNQKAIVNGAVSGGIASAAVFAFVKIAENILPELKTIRDLTSLSFLFIALILLGIGITLFSTHRSVIKYLKMKLDELY